MLLPLDETTLDHGLALTRQVSEERVIVGVKVVDRLVECKGRSGDAIDGDGDVLPALAVEQGIDLQKF